MQYSTRPSLAPGSAAARADTALQRAGRFALVVLLLAVGCVSPNADDEPFQPRKVRPAGPYLHAYTELVFPERSGLFERAYVTEYDPGRANVSGHYSSPASLPSIATVYHYPATAEGSAPSAEEFLAHFEQTKADVRQAWPAAALTHSGGVTAEINGFSLNGAHARFSVYHTAFEGEADSHLYLFALDGWYLKFRFTHPVAIADEIIPMERRFIGATTWPIPD